MVFNYQLSAVSYQRDLSRELGRRSAVAGDMAGTAGDGDMRQVEQFAATTGRYPTGWSELVGARRWPGIPVDPAGVPYAYDPSTHVVSLGPESGLAPLPRALPR